MDETALDRIEKEIALVRKRLNLGPGELRSIKVQAAQEELPLEKIDELHKEGQALLREGNKLYAKGSELCDTGARLVALGSDKIIQARQKRSCCDSEASCKLLADSEMLIEQGQTFLNNGDDLRDEANAMINSGGTMIARAMFALTKHNPSCPQPNPHITVERVYYP
jgi:hypothetical protein